MYSLKFPDLASSPLVEKVSWVNISLLLAGCGAGSNGTAPASVRETGTPGAEASVGERLFLETRFAQSFKVFLDHGGNINNPKAGDLVVAIAETPDPLVPIAPGAFKGMSMNCSACHMVDDLLTTVSAALNKDYQRTISRRLPQSNSDQSAPVKPTQSERGIPSLRKARALLPPEAPGVRSKDI